jgi:hypothetical protein
MSAFLPVATFFLSAAIVIITALQWRVAHHKLRLDLFGRRYKVYDATRKFLAVISRDTTFSNPDLFEFDAGTSDAQFLFRPDVAEYLSKIRNSALDLRTTHELLKKPHITDDELARLAQKQSDDLSWLRDDQIVAMTKTFAPYLGFQNVRFDDAASHAMKRTLLAVGIAILISTLCIPGGGTQTYGVPFFNEYCCDRIAWEKFALQTIFLSVAAAVIVNLFRRRTRK